MKNYCSYYQVIVPRATTWFLIGILRSYEHLVFERTLDKEKGVLEFFVPTDLEIYFIDLMVALEKKEIIRDLKKLPNRLTF